MERTLMLTVDNPPLDDFQPTVLIDGIDDPEHPFLALMSVEEYMANVLAGSIIDYDGYGHPATQSHEDQRFTVLPSLGRACIPHLATHINWFNK